MDRLGNGAPSGVVAHSSITKNYTLHASAAEIVTGNSASIYAGDYREGLLTINITAVTGTTPSCQFALQAFDGIAWYNVPNVTIAAQTAAGKVIVPVTNFGDQLQLTWTITGTTPSFTFSSNFLAKS